MILPIGNQILVKPLVKEQILVSDNELKCDYGIVEAVGEEVTKVKVGQKIGYERWGTKELEVGDETYTFIAETSDFLLCIIED